MHPTPAAACDEIAVLESNMRAVERQLAALASDMAYVTLLQTIPGVGPERGGLIGVGQLTWPRDGLLDTRSA